MAEPTDPPFGKAGSSQETDADSICSSTSSRRSSISSFHCFDDSSDDEPNMMEEWDMVREISGRNAFWNFEVIAKGTMVMMITQFGNQAVIVGCILTAIYVNPEKLRSKITPFVQPLKPLIEAMKTPAIEWLIGNSIMAQHPVQSDCSDCSDWMVTELYELCAARPGCKKASFALSIAVTVAVVASKIRTPYGRRLLNQFTSWFGHFLQLFILFSTYLAYFGLLTSILLNGDIFLTIWAMLLVAAIYLMIFRFEFQRALLQNGLTTWIGIPIPWKGTEPRLSTYPFYLIEGRRWVDRRIFGVRFKGRRIALWKFWKIWYYASISFFILNMALIPLCASELLRRDKKAFRLGLTTRNEAFEALAGLVNGPQCWKDERRAVVSPEPRVVDFMLRDFDTLSLR